MILRRSEVAVSPRPRSPAVAFVVLAVSLIGASLAARAAAPPIDDRVGFFSAAAIDQANAVVRRIYEQTRPHKDVLIVTVPALPANTGPSQLAEGIFRERMGNGILVLAVKKPHELRVVVGRETREHFGDAERDELSGILRERFHKQEFDQGLIDGVTFLERKLIAAFPADSPRQVRDPAAESPLHAPRSTGLPAWLWLVLILGGIWLVFSLIRSATAGSPGVGVGPPVGAGYGGGFGRSLLGGLFGVMAGSWLYDSFFGRGEGGMGYGGERGGEASDPGRGADDGQVGSVGGGDWGDSDKTDDGGGFDGGDSGGGGDW